MTDRKHFSKIFEGKDSSVGTPEVTLRRMTGEEEDQHRIRRGDNIGIWWGSKLIAFLDFDDLFDHEGNRFYND